jgi:2-polyprenyl-3-methyl-5-hydroxy-6-metoxy-1,4-benzoquinol methylase
LPGGELGFGVLWVDVLASGIGITQAHSGGSAAFLCRAIGSELAAELGRERFDVVVSSEVIGLESVAQPRACWLAWRSYVRG